MHYNRLGRTNAWVSALALGTVELGIDYGIPVPHHYGRPPEEEAIALVHASLDAGVNFIDTARAYGRSERILGRALGERRGEVVLATKTTTRDRDGRPLEDEQLRRHMLDSLEQSLTELQTDWVDIWQIHNFDQALLSQLDVVTHLFAEVRREGKVKWFGASTYGVAMPAAAIRCHLFDVIQVTYSVLDQRLADEIFELAAARDIGVVVRSVLLQGALTERGDYLPDHLEDLRSRSRQFRALVRESGVDLSPAQVAIAFGLAHPRISAVLLGVRSQEELAEDLQAVASTLPDKLLSQLHKLRLDDPDLLNPATWHIVPPDMNEALREAVREYEEQDADPTTGQEHHP